MHKPRGAAKDILNLTVRSFRVDTRGAAAAEFALISGTFLLGIPFVLAVALTEFLGRSLDSATRTAASQAATSADESWQEFERLSAPASFRRDIRCAN